ncbi:hypothetical protein Leryth_020550 [Lithospermum erythrorhizon]|nr:hypothetical protein Leryth_020550 [Lithospermum erythrorhizon]
MNGPIDRSKVRVLLMDTNIETCQEILAVLCNCSYQVIPVWQAPEVHEVLMNFSGTEIDIILAEAGLLMANNAQIMTFIMHTKVLRNIPVIMSYQVH